MKETYVDTEGTLKHLKNFRKVRLHLDETIVYYCPNCQRVFKL